MNKSALLTAITLGAGLGFASYLMHGPAAQAPAVTVDEQATFVMDTSAIYWQRQAVASEVLSYDKHACEALYGEHYHANGAACDAPVECTGCISTHKGPIRNAVIHDNTWVRGKKSGPDYDAMMRQYRLVAAMSVADRAATEAGRKAYDHSIRCSRLTWRADAQCK